MRTVRIRRRTHGGRTPFPLGPRPGRARATTAARVRWRIAIRTAPITGSRTGGPDARCDFPYVCLPLIVYRPRAAAAVTGPARERLCTTTRSADLGRRRRTKRLPVAAAAVDGPTTVDRATVGGRARCCSARTRCNTAFDLTDANYCGGGGLRRPATRERSNRTRAARTRRRRRRKRARRFFRCQFFFSCFPLRRRCLRSTLGGGNHAHAPIIVLRRFSLSLAFDIIFAFFF